MKLNCVTAASEYYCQESSAGDFDLTARLLSAGIRNPLSWDLQQPGPTHQRGIMWDYRRLGSSGGSNIGCPCWGSRPILFRSLCVVFAVLVVSTSCYFLTPRMPDICFGMGYPTRFSASVSRVSMSVPFNVSVSNHNYYGILLPQTTINLVYLNTAVLSPLRTPVTLSTVSAPSVHVRARKTTSISFTATMNSNAGTVLADAGMLRDCTTTRSTTLYVNMSVVLFNWIHITIPNQPITIKCSVSAFSLAKLLPAADSQSHSSYFCNTR